MSNYCTKIVDKYRIKVGDVKKLIPNLENKTNYIVYYKHFHLYLSLGMKPAKIHKVLRFKQSNRLNKYIYFNTEKIKNAANNFEKDFFKLMINCVYGKTMENLRKRINIKLVNNEKSYLKQSTNQLLFLKKIFTKILLLFMK